MAENEELYLIMDDSNEIKPSEVEPMTELDRKIMRELKEEFGLK